MAIRLVNKSKADCDINLYSGRVVRLRPLSHITLEEKITKASIDYYRQLSDLGLYLEQDVEPKIEEKPVEEKVPETNTGAEVKAAEVVETSDKGAEVTIAPEEKDDCPCCGSEEVTTKDLMKHNHKQLVEIAATYGLGNLETLSKKEICAKIIEAASAEK